MKSFLKKENKVDLKEDLRTIYILFIVQNVVVSTFFSNFYPFNTI